MIDAKYQQICRMRAPTQNVKIIVEYCGGHASPECKPMLWYAILIAKQTKNFRSKFTEACSHTAMTTARLLTCDLIIAILSCHSVGLSEMFDNPTT